MRIRLKGCAIIFKMLRTAEEMKTNTFYKKSKLIVWMHWSQFFQKALKNNLRNSLDLVEQNRILEIWMMKWLMADKASPSACYFFWEEMQEKNVKWRKGRRLTKQVKMYKSILVHWRFKVSKSQLLRFYIFLWKSKILIIIEGAVNGFIDQN